MKLKNPIYFRISHKPIQKTIDIEKQGVVFVDVDHDGNIVGVEILADAETKKLQIEE